jgi:hypothetical protein
MSGRGSTRFARPQAPPLLFVSSTTGGFNAVCLFYLAARSREGEGAGAPGTQATSGQRTAHPGQSASGLACVNTPDFLRKLESRTE